MNVWTYLSPYGAPKDPIPTDVPLIVLRKSGVEQEVVWKGGLWWDRMSYLKTIDNPVVFWRKRD